MAWCRPGYKPLSEPMMVELLMYVYVIQPQWIKSIRIPIKKIRQSRDRLIFLMGIAIPEDMIFILRRGPGYALENTMNSVSQPDTKKMIHNNDRRLINNRQQRYIWSTHNGWKIELDQLTTDNHTEQFIYFWELKYTQTAPIFSIAVLTFVERSNLCFNNDKMILQPGSFTYKHCIQLSSDKRELRIWTHKRTCITRLPIANCVSI